MKKMICLFVVAMCTIVSALAVEGAGLFYDWPEGDDNFKMVISVSPDTPVPDDRDPVQVLYLIDVSERCAGNVRQQLIDGGVEMVTRLRDTDFFGIVLYSTYSRTILPLTEISVIGRGRITEILDGISTESGRDPYEAIDRVASEFYQTQGRKNDGRILVFTVLGETPEDGNGGSYETQYLRMTDSLGVVVHTFGYSDGFDEDAAISLAEKTGGRAYFAGTDYVENLRLSFEQVSLLISNPHVRLIDLEPVIWDGIQIHKWGEPDSLIDTVRIPVISNNSHVLSFYELSHRPEQSTDFDIEYDYYDIVLQSQLSGNTSFKIGLARRNGEYNSSVAPYLIRYQLLYELVKTVPDIRRGDRAYRLNYASGFRGLIEDRLVPIRNEIGTTEMQKVYTEMIGIYDILSGGTTSDKLFEKIVKYALHDCHYPQQ